MISESLSYYLSCPIPDGMTCDEVAEQIHNLAPGSEVYTFSMKGVHCNDYMNHFGPNISVPDETYGRGGVHAWVYHTVCVVDGMVCDPRLWAKTVPFEEYKAALEQLNPGIKIVRELW